MRATAEPSYGSSASSWGDRPEGLARPQLGSTKGLIRDRPQTLVHGGSHSRCGKPPESN